MVIIIFHCKETSTVRGMNYVQYSSLTPVEDLHIYRGMLSYDESHLTNLTIFKHLEFYKIQTYSIQPYRLLQLCEHNYLHIHFIYTLN